MNKKWLILFLLFCLWASPLQASSLTVSQNLSFGTLIPLNSSGSVIISTAGAINTGGSVTVAPSGTGYYQGIVKFTPTILDLFTFKILNSSVILTNSSPGGGSVTIDNFTISPSSLNITILSAVNINIGGRMTYSSASKSGTYNGSVTVQASSLLGGTINATLPITLTLWSNLSMNQITPLNFGTIEVGNSSAVIRINPQNGIRTIISGSGINLAPSPTPTAAQFNISGQQSVNISIALPSAITLTGSNGGTMSVNNFTGYPSSTSSTLDSNGSRSLYIGADLNIGSSQPSGTYSGTYTVTVNY